MSLRQWLADQFAFAFWSVAARPEDIDLRRAFGAVYVAVPGSHVLMCNTQNFGVTGSVLLGDFFRP